MATIRQRYRNRASLATLTLLTFCLILLARDWPVWSSRAFLTMGHNGPSDESRPLSYGALRSSGTKPSVKGNMHPHLRYLVTFYYAGFTNQVMMLMNQIHLSQLTDHIPVLSPFTVYAHLHGNAPRLDPSTVFDLRQYSQGTGLPIVLLDELKTGRGSPLGPEDAESEEEDLACWGVHQTRTNGSTFNNDQVSEYKFRLSRYPVPLSFRQDNKYGGEMALDPLVDFINPVTKGSLQWVNSTGMSNEMSEQFQAWGTAHPTAVLPDVLTDPLTCVDELYYVTRRTGIVIDEYLNAHEDSTWATVGVKLRWHPHLLAEARALEKKVLGVRPMGSVPKFFAVHIRRTDQLPDRCKNYLATKDDPVCKPPSVWVEALERVKQSAIDQGIIKAGEEVRVLLMTDETDKDFLDELKRLGWIYIDHTALRTVEETGDLWRPTLLDTVIMSDASGFVGFHGSSMSVLAARRVADWNHAPFELIYRW